MKLDVYELADARRKFIALDTAREHTRQAYQDGRLHCSRCLSPLVMVRGGGYRCSTGCSVVAERWMRAAWLSRHGWVGDAYCTRCGIGLLLALHRQESPRWCPGCGDPRGPQ